MTHYQLTKAFTVTVCEISFTIAPRRRLGLNNFMLSLYWSARAARVRTRPLPMPA
jgi:hypothetical protein